MELKKKFVLMILFIIGFILLLNTSSYAGTQRWDSLDYYVTVNNNGSMNVVETWEIFVSETNTLFKSFEIDRNGDYSINNAKVFLVQNNKEIPLKQIYQQQHHVDSGCYYGLQIDNSTYEIAWNVGLDNSSATRTYKIYYTVENAVKIYNDCTELYWQFFSTNNSISGGTVTGTINLPKKVSDIEKLRVWGHGDLTAEIQKASNRQVKFNLNRLYANEMLEVRVVTEENIYSTCTNTYNKDYLNKILEEEQNWANIANNKRAAAAQEWENMKKLIFAAIIINILLIIPFLFKMNKYRSIGKELKQQYSYPKSDLEYFRDIPDEKNATPAKAMYLYNFSNNNSYMEMSVSKVFSATILDLALKGVIAFEVTEFGDVRIVRSNKANAENLSEDEQIIYDLLKEAMLGKSYITPNDFEIYAKDEYETVYGKLNTLGEIAKNLHKASGNIVEERTFISKQWKSKASLYMIFMLMSAVALCAGIVTPLICLGILYYMCIKNSEYVSILSLKGETEKNQWKALKHYMVDYSLLKEKLVPDIVLWEKYLVYATAFGVSKKLLEQLKMVHPEMFNQTERMEDSTYWDVVTNRRVGFAEFEKFSRDLEEVYNEARTSYNIAHSPDSDGSGGGGGFSSGGGGRRRWRKLWWTLKFYKYK